MVVCHPMIASLYRWTGSLAWLALGCSLQASDWPQWRGPARTGVSTETGWLQKWPTEGPKVAWKANVGMGFSSWVVAGNRALTLGYADGKDSVVCFEVSTGKVQWRHSYPSELGDKYFEGGTTGTPTIAGDQVLVLSRWGDVFCLRLADGQVVWSKNLAKDIGVPLPDWGFGGAPLVRDNRVYLNVGENGLALDQRNGVIVWKSAAESAGYSTPLLLPGSAEPAAVFSSGQAYAGVELKTGKVLWTTRWVTQYGVNAADPILDGDRLFISSGYGKGAGLFKLGGAEPELVWKSKSLRTQMNAAVLFQGHLYGVDGDTTEKATLKCLDWNTGQEKWAVPGFGSGGLIVADGKLIALNGTGELSVAPATPEGFKPVARAQILGGKTWTAPVLANGYVYARNSRGDVVCLDLRAARE